MMKVEKRVLGVSLVVSIFILGNVFHSMPIYAQSSNPAASNQTTGNQTVMQQKGFKIESVAILTTKHGGNITTVKGTPEQVKSQLTNAINSNPSINSTEKSKFIQEINQKVDKIITTPPSEISYSTKC